MKRINKVLIATIFICMFAFCGLIVEDIKGFSSIEPNDSEETIVLPEGYTQVCYIQGVGAQYIDTGYVANPNTKVEMTLIDDSVDYYENYFGGSKFRFLRNDSNASNYLINPENGSKNININLTNKRTLTFSSSGITDENNNVYANSLSMIEDTKNMLIFGSYLNNNFDRYGYFKLYGFKIFENDTLIRSFIPVRNNSDGEAGLYEVKEGKFYANQGSGVFGYKLGENKPIPEYEIDETKYKKLDYVVNNSNQYIDTGIPVTAGYDYELDYTLISGSATNLYGATTGYNHYLFAYNNNGTLTITGAKIKFYRFSIFDQNGDCIQNLIPVLDLETNNAVLYDTITGKILENHNKFIAGEEIQAADERYASLPSEYTQVEYIESSGTQYIDTGVSDIYRFEGKIQIDKQATSNGPCIYGVTDNASNYLYMNNGSTVFRLYQAYNGKANEYWPRFTLKEIIKIDINYIDCVWTVGANSGTIANIIEMPIQNGNIFLFANNNKGTVNFFNSFKLIDFKMYDKEGVLVRSFIPAIRNFDGEIGLYDQVESKFYGNSAYYGEEFYYPGENRPELTYEIPEEYQEIDYISTTGVQWIDTGIYANLSDDIDIEYSFDNVSVGNSYNQYFWGVYDNIDTSVNYRIRYHNYENTINKVGAQNTVIKNPATLPTIVAGQKQTVSTYGGRVRVNGKDFFVSFNEKYEDEWSDLTYYLFGYNNNGATSIFPVAMNLHKYVVYDSLGTVRQNLVPVYRKADEKAGLFDTVSGNFFVSKTATDFVLPEQFKDQLPSEYKRVEYVVNAGQTQWIDTGIQACLGDRIHMTFNQFVHSQNRNGFWGVDDAEFKFYLNNSLGYGTPNASIALVKSDTTATPSKGVFGPWNHYTYRQKCILKEISKNNFSCDGSKSTSSFTYDETKTSEFNYYMFALNKSGTVQITDEIIQICDYIIYDNNDVVRQHLIPAMKIATGEVGFYDRTNAEFLTNQGEGNLYCELNDQILIEVDDGIKHVDWEDEYNRYKSENSINVKGSGTSADPYLVNDVYELTWALKQGSKVLSLQKDIYFNDGKFVDNKYIDGGDGVLYNWRMFTSTADSTLKGNNHKIYCYYSNYTGFNCLAYVYDLEMDVNIWSYSSGVAVFHDKASNYGGPAMRNVTTTGNIYSLGGHVTAFCRFSTGGATIKNCENYANLTACASGWGQNGVAPFSGTLTNCKNYGKITQTFYSAWQGSASGIGGSTNVNCINYGEVYSAYSAVGIGGSSNTGCINYGKVYSAYSAAGIGGTSNGCINYGKVTAVSSSACGISTSGTKKNCINYGEVYSEKSTAMGMGVYASGSTGCVNYGKIEGTTAIGLFQYPRYNQGSVTNLKNYGEVVGTNLAVGILTIPQAFGGKNLTITNCHNYGNISGPKSAGVLISTYLNQSDFSALKDCTNSGRIYSTSEAGGIMTASGTGPKDMDFINCRNMGDVVSDNSAGGIYGTICTGHTINAEYSFINCANSGTIKGKTAGALAGRLDTGCGDKVYIKNFLNTGSVTQSLVTGTFIIGQNEDSILVTKKSIIFDGMLNGTALKYAEGQDFNAYYWSWRSGKIGLKELDGNSCFQGVVTPEYLQNQGFEVDYIPDVNSQFATKYTQLEYIESTGTQYIDTGYVANHNTKVEVDFESTTTNTTNTIFCSRESYTTNTFSLFKISNTCRFDYGNTLNTISQDLGTGRYQIVADKNKLYIDEALTSEAQATSFMAGGTMWIGASYVSPYTGISNYSYMKLYSFKIYNGSETVRSFVPAKRVSDGVVGLYDTVEGKFYANQGTGNFVAGAAK